MEVQSECAVKNAPDRSFRGLLFVVGIILSPATWWNDAFVNMPLSYLVAHPLFRLTGLPFNWLVIASYWFTNILGVALVYVSGKGMVRHSKHPVRSTAWIIILILLYTFLMLYLDHIGWLKPIDEVAVTMGNGDSACPE